MTTTLKEILEKETCGRCGGSGHYSFNMLDGTRCYGCGGSGSKYTKRGAAAKAYYLAMLTTDIALAQAGDRMFDRSSGWWTIEKIELSSEEIRSSCGLLELGSEKLAEAEARGARIGKETTQLDGRTMARCYEGYDIDCTRKTRRGEQRMGFGGQTGTIMLAPGDCKTALLKSTAAFQESLTKAGKPRKR
jgi:hypothetical protein